MQPLLSTKLFIPQLTENHIKRDSQVHKLLRGFEKNNQLTLVCAPAGFGKTTLVLEFLRAVGRTAAWLSLDDGDNDAQRFLAYFTAALKNTGIIIGNDIEALISDISFSTSETVLTMLINQIAAKEDRFILVLDDYHLIHSQKINDILKYLLDHQPCNLHIIIISREDPKLPLARLRMKDKLTEVRFGELMFSNEEASAFFYRMIGNKLSNQEIEKVTIRTEGWIAGLQLAALLLKSYNNDQADDFILKFDGTNHYIIDYLVEEVLEHQGEDIRNFLCRTSILERMNDRLCNKLTDRLDSRDVLAEIEKKNLFLIPLDDRKEWFRYHHLFADSLRTSLSKEEERDLYKIASVWMKENGFTHEAVRYAFKSKDLALAVKMVEDSVLETFQTAQLDSLIEWMENLPEDMIKNSEILCVRKAIALFITGRFKEAVHYFNKLDSEFEKKASAHNKGLMFTARAMLATAQGKDAEPLAKEALKYLEPWDPIAITSNLNSIGRAQYRKGNVTEAAITFHNAYNAGIKIGYQFITTLALMNYSLCLQTIGQTVEAVELCNQFINEMEKVYDKLPPYIGVLYTAMAELYIHNNEPEKARYYMEEGTALCKSISYDVEASIQMYKNYIRKNLYEEAQQIAVENFTEGSPEESEKEAVNKEEKALLKDDDKKTGKESEKVNARFNGSEASKAVYKITGEENVAVNFDEYTKKSVELDYGEKLSGRETEILLLIGKGLSNQEIADTLFISTNTTQWHISHIYAKLGVKSRMQAMIKAKEMGILS